MKHIWIALVLAFVVAFPGAILADEPIESAVDSQVLSAQIHFSYTVVGDIADMRILVPTCDTVGYAFVEDDSGHIEIYGERVGKWIMFPGSIDDGGLHFLSYSVMQQEDTAIGITTLEYDGPRRGIEDYQTEMPGSVTECQGAANGLYLPFISNN